MAKLTVGSEFQMMMVKCAPLPDGTTLYDLMLRPDIGQEEARATYEAALINSPDTPKLVWQAVEAFARAHGYDVRSALRELVYTHCDVILADLQDLPGTVMH